MNPWEEYANSEQETGPWSDFAEQPKVRTPEEDRREAAAVQSLNEHKFRNGYGGTSGFDPARLKKFGEGALAIPAAAVNLLTGAIGGAAKLAVAGPVAAVAAMDSNVRPGQLGQAITETTDAVAEKFTTHLGGEEGQALTNAVGQVVSAPLRGAQWLADKAAEPTTEADYAIMSPVARALRRAEEPLKPLMAAATVTAANAAATVGGIKASSQAIKPGKFKVTGNVDALAKAQKLGFRVSSHVGNKSLASDLSHGASGKIKTAQVESVKNQPIVQDLVKKELGLKPSQRLDLSALKDLDDAAKANVTMLKQLDPGGKPASPTLGWVEPSTRFQSALDKITQSGKTAERDFGKLQGASALDVDALIAQHKNVDGFGAGAGIDRVFQLRELANASFRNADPIAGRAYKGVAEAIENAIDEHLTVNGVQTDLVGMFREARTQIAKTDAVRKRMNPATGNVDAVGLSRDLEKSMKGKGGTPLTGGLKDVAEAAMAAPKSFQLPEKLGAVTHFSPLDTAAAVIGGDLKSAAVVASRAPLRQFLASKYHNAHSGAAVTIAKQVDKAMKRTALKRGSVAALTAGEIASMQNWTEDKTALERAQ